MHLLAASKDMGECTRKEIAASIGAWLKSVGVYNNADEDIAKQKTCIAELEAEVARLKGEKPATEM